MKGKLITIAAFVGAYASAETETLARHWTVVTYPTPGWSYVPGPPKGHAHIVVVTTPYPHWTVRTDLPDPPKTKPWPTHDWIHLESYPYPHYVTEHGVSDPQTTKFVTETKVLSENKPIPASLSAEITVDYYSDHPTLTATVWNTVWQQPVPTTWPTPKMNPPIKPTWWASAMAKFSKPGWGRQTVELQQFPNPNTRNIWRRSETTGSTSFETMGTTIAPTPTQSEGSPPSSAGGSGAIPSFQLASDGGFAARPTGSTATNVSPPQPSLSSSPSTHVSGAACSISPMAGALIVLGLGSVAVIVWMLFEIL